MQRTFYPWISDCGNLPSAGLRIDWDIKGYSGFGRDLFLEKAVGGNLNSKIHDGKNSPSRN